MSSSKQLALRAILGILFFVPFQAYAKVVVITNENASQFLYLGGKRRLACEYEGRLIGRLSTNDIRVGAKLKTLNLRAALATGKRRVKNLKLKLKTSPLTTRKGLRRRIKTEQNRARELRIAGKACTDWFAIQRVSSISQYGITWFFDKKYPAGRFISGDWWVVGPVTLTARTSRNMDTPGLDGAMLDILPDKQGYDSRPSNYVEDLNIVPKLPVVLEPGQRLVSAESWVSGDSGYTTSLGGSYQELYNAIVLPESPTIITLAAGWGSAVPGKWLVWDFHGAKELRRVVAVNGNELTVDYPVTPKRTSIKLGAWLRPYLKTAIVITSVSAPPPADAFRPPYAGNWPGSYFQASKIKWERLPRLARVAGTADLTEYEEYTQRVWLDHGYWYFAETCRPNLNLLDYPQYSTKRYNDASLLLLLDYSLDEKKKLAHHLIQIGIDSYGAARGGSIYPAGGGHGSGRLWPIILAGYLLDDQDMLSIRTDQVKHPHSLTSFRFGEVEQTFYVERSDLERVHHWQGWPPKGEGFPPYEDDHGVEYVDYREEDLGLAEWGIRHWSDPDRDNKAWNSSYRLCCTAIAWGGAILGSRVLGLTRYWDHDALFDYYDRYMQAQGASASFSDNMWSKYRPVY